MARSSGLLLRALVLAFFAAMGVAGRPQPISQSSAAEGLARALGLTAGTSIGCCTCSPCTMIYPVELSACACSGVFLTCPAFCEGGCSCFGPLCTCNSFVSYPVCMANKCDLLAASAHAAKGDAVAELAEK